MAQLTINRLPLPSELHTIIKDYAFSLVERKKLWILKNVSTEEIHVIMKNILKDLHELWFMCKL